VSTWGGQGITEKEERSEKKRERERRGGEGRGETQMYA
jgi:hypothetical protein